MKKINLILIAFSILLLNTCTDDSNLNPNSSGQGGSMARFTIIGNYLYTVDNTRLNIFKITNSQKPEFLKTLTIGQSIETIFPKGNTLFIGSQNGMLIYDITDQENPVSVSSYSHIYACDPVIADSNYAYITLHSELNLCGRTTNELIIVSIKDLTAPYEIKTYPMTSPLGLGKKDSLLFICDKGLKIFDASDVLNLKQLHYFNIKAYDVIPIQSHLLVIGSDGLYQYNYSGTELSLMSQIKY